MPNPVKDQKSQDDAFSENQPNFYPENVEIERRGPIHQSDLVVGVVKQRHLEQGANIIFHGPEAKLPDGSTYVKAYYCDDTFKLKIFNGSVWKTAQLT
jgi:hypothetical protein